MGHAAEGSLQAYLDGEIDSAAEAGLSEHLAVCEACTAELAVLRSGSEVARAAFALLDAQPHTLRARAAVGRGAVVTTRSRMRQVGTAGFAKAAMLLLALAGAGTAAIPGSPVRRALEATVARVAQLFNGADGRTAVTPAPAATPAEPVAGETSSISIAPSSGSVRVMLHAPAGGVDVIVRLADVRLATVVTTMDEGAVRFVSGTGRLEVIGLGAGKVELELPRTVENVSVQVGGLVHVYKVGADLRLTGPAGEGQGSEVRFRIGS